VAESCYSVAEGVQLPAIDTPEYRSYVRDVLVCAHSPDYFQALLFQHFNTGIQYTPVDCMATSAHLSTSHLAISRRSAVEAIKPPHRLRVPVRADGHPMLAAANIDAGRIRMYDIQRFHSTCLRAGPSACLSPSFAYLLLVLQDCGFGRSDS